MHSRTASAAKHLSALALAVSLPHLLTAPTQANTKTWDPNLPSDGDWHNADNWTGFGVPTVDDDVEILIDDQVMLTADSASDPFDAREGIDSLQLEGSAELSTGGHRLHTFVEGGIIGGQREDFTVIRGPGAVLRIQAGASPNDFETFQLMLEDGGQLLIEGGVARVGAETGGSGSSDVSVDASSGLRGTGTLTVDGDVDNRGDYQLDGQTAVDGALANSGMFHVIGQGEIGGAVDNQVDGLLIIDNLSVCCDARLTLHDLVENFGAFDLTSQTEQDSILELTAAVPTVLNRAGGTLRLTGPGDLDGNGAIDGKRIIRADVSNLGVMQIQANTQIEGSLGVGIDAETVIDGASACCSVLVDVDDGITNSGMFDVTAPPKGVTINLGVGQSFTNNASGVVDFKSQVDSGSPPGEAIVVGDVDNSGQFNVRTNTQIDGALTNRPNAETLIDSIDDCCNMTFELTEGIANSGALTITSSGGQPVTIQVGEGQTFTNNASGVVNFEEQSDEGSPPAESVVSGSVENSGQVSFRTNVQIDGRLENANGSDFVLESLARDVAVDVAEGVRNSGTLTMTASAADDVILGITAEHSFVNELSGTLAGVGTIAGNLTNSGRIEPGSSRGTLTVNGDFIQEADGTLVIEAAGATPGEDYDQLAVGGDVQLDGVVQLVLEDGFTPAPGNVFDVITSASLTGQFSDAFLPGLPEGMQWQEEYQSGGFSLRVIDQIAGDFNADGLVNGEDFLAWQRGSSPDPSSAGDLADWHASYGTATSTLSLGTRQVPEPTSAGLLALALGTTLLGRRLPRPLRRG